MKRLVIGDHAFFIVSPQKTYIYLPTYFVACSVLIYEQNRETQMLEMMEHPLVVLIGTASTDV